MSTKLTKTALVATILAILFLDFAALDDITTGREPHSALVGEYLMLAGSIPLLVLNVRLLKK